MLSLLFFTCIMNTTTLKSGFNIKIVNEDDHSIRFQIGSEKRWLDPKCIWEVEIDPTEESQKYCKAWFNGIQQESEKFRIWEGNNIKFMIRKDDGIYKANFDGTNEVCQNSFDVESLLSHRMAQMKCVGVYTVKIVNEDDHPILFTIDENKKWVKPTEEFEVIITPSSKGICAAWFNEADEEPMEFSIWAEKDTKFMVRKDDGIYKADLDGSNEECHVKLKVESHLAQPIGKLKCLSACKVLIQNDSNDYITFEIDGVKHTLSSKDAFDMNIGDDVTEICKTEFKGLQGEPMEFKVYGNNFSDFKVYEENGMYTAEVNILDKKSSIILNIVREENNILDYEAITESMEESMEQNDTSIEINANDIDSTNENDQDIFVDNTKPQQVMYSKGKDGAPNRCVGFLPKKRELDGKFEESSNAKKLKLRSQSDSFYRM